MPIRGYVFDAYGTLFDVHSVVEAGRDITTDPLALSLLWRQKQLECTWLRSLMERYEDFASDVVGAGAFGYRVAWCNRTGAPDEELGVRADFVVTGLEQLPAEG